MNDNNSEGTLTICQDGLIEVRLDALSFLSKRVKIEPTLNELVKSLWELKGDNYESVDDLMAGWLYELEDVLKSKPKTEIYDALIEEFARHGELRGAADNGEAFIASSDVDSHNLLNKEVIHLEFKIRDKWFALVAVECNPQQFTLPIAVSIEDKTRLFENENAIVRPDGLDLPRYELHQGRWFVIGRNSTDLPLDRYPVSMDVADKGRLKTYWDGAVAYCPITGHPLNVASYDRSMKDESIT